MIGKVLAFLVFLSVFVDGFFLMLYGVELLQLVGLLLFTVSVCPLSLLAYSFTVRDEDDPKLIVGNPT